ncbi:MAG: CPCC family cysteine-rich protein [Candidatus Paceibacterota bacterium]
MNNQENTLLPCPCCRKNTITEKGSYEICDMCRWEDDPIQSADPDYVGGANKLSLNQYRKIHAN